MIQINNSYGKKIIFINWLKNVTAIGLGVEQFLPTSQHHRPTNVALHIKNSVTQAEFDVELTYESGTTRGAYYSFVLGDGTGGTWNVSQSGTFEYFIYEMTTAGGVNYADKLFELDRGLFHIFNNDTFTDKYVTPDVETIPATIVYKP